MAVRARAYQVARSWVHTLLARYQAEGDAAFEARSQRPKTSPNTISGETADLIVRHRKELSEQLGELPSQVYTPSQLQVSHWEFTWTTPPTSCSSADVATAAHFSSNPAGLALLQAKVFLEHTGTTPAYLCQNQTTIISDPLGVFPTSGLSWDTMQLPSTLTLTVPNPGSAYAANPYPVDIPVVTTIGQRLVRLAPAPPLTDTENYPRSPGRVCRCQLRGDATSVVSPRLAFADWKVIGDNHVDGLLHGLPIRLTGALGTGTVLDGTFTNYDSDLFSPRLAHSDTVNIEVQSDSAYKINFGAPVQDPILHLYSFASVFTFPPGTALAKVSGEPMFTVSGTTASGIVRGEIDSNGTIRLYGRYTSLEFSARPNFLDGSDPDGIYVQIGALSVT